MCQVEWQIIVGAYKVEPEGVYVRYELCTDHKALRLLKGDLHVHTLASDGVHTVEELGWKAQRNGLDFLAITDHNQMSTAVGMPQVPGITLDPRGGMDALPGTCQFPGRGSAL